MFNYVADVEAIKNSFQTWKRTGHVSSHEIWLKTKKGTTFPTLLSANNLYDKNGNLIGSSIIIKDISEIYEARKKIERQAVMELQLAELKKLEKAKDEFVSMMTHELKTPLTPIFGYCDMLKEPGLLGNLNPVQLNSVNRISQSSRRLGRLIEEILEAQRLGMGNIKFDKQEFDVTKLMTEIHNDYIQLMKEKQIKIINYTEEKLTLKSDRNRIRQVIDNMVFNSTDFMPEKDGEISIGAIRVDDEIVFHVKDNGMGIPQDEFDKIFVKFYQVDISHTRKHPGTGLGLSICKGIVEGLGGKIWVESELGKGTSFYFSIPQEK
jgi:signal transduction histidine kinase